MFEQFFPPWVHVNQNNTQVDEAQIELQAGSTVSTANCPDCNQKSARIHSTYDRRPHDLPCIGKCVRLTLQVRRFFCDNEACERRTFAESFAGWLKRYARRTDRLQEQQLRVAFECGGEAGRRTLRAVCMEVSGDTLLRAIRAAPEEEMPKPRVIGIDDWAQRKRFSYGTLVIDLETQQPIELLEARDSETVAAWLKQQPQIEVVSRDRSREYAKAITAALPNADQVADRWHLLANLRTALEKILITKPACLQAAAPLPEKLEAVDNGDDEQPSTVSGSEDVSAETQPSSSHPSTEETESEEETVQPPQPLTKAKREQLERRARKQERYDRVNALHAVGHSNQTIAREMYMSMRTVRKYLEADCCPTYTTGYVYPSKLDPHLAWLEEQWRNGRTNATELWRELQREHGFTGSRGLVSRWAAPQRKLLPPDTQYVRKQPKSIRPKIVRQVTPPPWSASRVSWLLVQEESRLDDEAVAALERVVMTDEAVAHTWRLAQRFVAMIKERGHRLLDEWLEEAQTQKLVELQTFARGIRQDLAAVRNALKLHWSNGQTEGQVNRLKLIKRQTNESHT